MKVSDIMYTKLYTIEHDASVLKAAQKMHDHQIGSLLVEKHGEKIGIVTDRDIVRKVVTKDKKSSEVAVNDIMNSPIITVDKNKDVMAAVDLMIKKNIKRVLVVHAGEIVGIVSTRLIAKYMKKMLRKTS